jgi:hypothetical protein
MSSFRELRDFEKRFPNMDIPELKKWATYWSHHAEGLAPKVRKQAMKRVYEIEKIISRKLSQSGENERNENGA